MNAQSEPPFTQVHLAAALGISPPMVVKLKRKGMPVDSVEAAMEWRRANVNTRVMEHGYTVAVVPPRPQRGAPVGVQTDGEDSFAQPVEDLWASRARKEAAEASLAELKLEELTGRLVDREVVFAEHSKRVVQFRDAMLQIPARLSPLLVGQEDQGRIERLIDAELRQALVVFSGGANGS